MGPGPRLGITEPWSQRSRNTAVEDEGFGVFHLSSITASLLYWRQRWLVNFISETGIAPKFTREPVLYENLPSHLSLYIKVEHFQQHWKSTSSSLFLKKKKIHLSSPKTHANKFGRKQCFLKSTFRKCVPHYMMFVKPNNDYK